MAIIIVLCQPNTKTLTKNVEKLGQVDDLDLNICLVADKSAISPRVNVCRREFDVKHALILLPKCCIYYSHCTRLVHRDEWS